MTDTVLPVGEWPGAALSYAVTPGPLLAVTLAPAGAAAVEPYLRAYFQLCGDVTATLATSLADATFPVDVAALRRYAAAGFLAATAAASAEPLVTTRTVADLVADRGVTHEALAAANEDAVAAALFGGAVPAVPRHVAATGGKADASLLALNETVPLRAGAVLATPRLPVAVADPDASLADLAEAAFTWPGLLAEDNADVPGLLRDGAVLAFGEGSVTVSAETTFASAAADLGIDVAALAEANAAVPGLFANGAVPTSVHYVARAADTLAANESGVTAADLAAANAETAGLFDAGTPLYAGDATGVTVPPRMTLGALAEGFGLAPARLLAANPGLTLHDATVPGHATVPASARVPYTARAAETVGEVAARFGTDAAALVAENADMPGTLAPGQAVTSGEATTDTLDGDSFGAVAARLDGAMPDLSGALLAAGALLHCPLAPLAAGTTPAGAAEAFGVGLAAFTRENAATLPLVPGTALTVGGVSVTTGASYVLDAAVTAFARAGVRTTVEEVATANSTVPFLAAGGTALLPPAPVTFAAALPNALPETVAFPLEVTVALRLASGEGSAETLASQRVSADGGEAFAAAYPDLRPATDDAGGLWAVDVGANGVRDLTLSPGLAWGGGHVPRTFALRPLYTGTVRLEDLPVHGLARDGTLLREAEQRTFADVDTDRWAAELLADVDRFLSPAYAVPIAAADRDAYDRVVAAKATLVRAVADGLWLVPSVPGADETAGRAAAVDALSRVLARGLTHGHLAAALVQYEAALTPPARVLPGARLVGEATPLPGAPYDASPASVAVASASSSVTFALHTDVHDPVLPVDFGYRFTGAEVGARTLTLLPANGSRPAPLRVGPAGVPVVERSAPVRPTLLGQTSERSEGDDLAAAARWTFGVAFAHDLAARDVVEVTATFNVEPSPRALSAPATDDVARALARYVTVAAPLRALLDGFVTGAGEPSHRANAAASFAELVTSVATLWAEHWRVPSPAVAAPAADEHTVALRLRADGSGRYDSVAAVARTALPGPDGAWPRIAYLPPDGDPVPLLPGEAADGVRTFAFPVEVPVSSHPRLEVSWPGLAVTAFENARATVAASRNAPLPGSDEASTNARFRYATLVAAGRPVAPSNVSREGHDITAPDGVALALPEALSRALADLGGTDGAPATVATAYGVELVPADGDRPAIVAWTPVAFNDLPLGAGTGAAIAEQAREWLARSAYAGREETFRFDVTVSSRRDPGHVLLTATDLTYGLAPRA